MMMRRMKYAWESQMQGWMRWEMRYEKKRETWFDLHVNLTNLFFHLEYMHDMIEGEGTGTSLVHRGNKDWRGETRSKETEQDKAWLNTISSKRDSSLPLSVKCESWVTEWIRQREMKINHRLQCIKFRDIERRGHKGLQTRVSLLFLQFDSVRVFLSFQETIPETKNDFMVLAFNCLPHSCFSFALSLKRSVIFPSFVPQFCLSLFSS
jgi:hypothetical protein